MQGRRGRLLESLDEAWHMPWRLSFDLDAGKDGLKGSKDKLHLVLLQAFLM